MPNRYRFDLENGPETIFDETGVVADDLDQAIEQALAGIEEMRSDGELPDSVGGWTLIVRSESGAEVKRIPL